MWKHELRHPVRSSHRNECVSAAVGRGVRAYRPTLRSFQKRAEGPACGSATITGAGPKITTSTHANGVKYRTYAYAYNWAAAGKRTVTVANLATRSHPDLQLDTIIILT